MQNMLWIGNKFFSNRQLERVCLLIAYPNLMSIYTYGQSIITISKPKPKKKTFIVYQGIHQAEEVRVWMTAAIARDKVVASKRDMEKKVLVLTGPAGCGKSAAVLTIAAELHVHVHQWAAPAAMTFRESRHMGFQTTSREKGWYVGKIEEFEQFVAQASRFRPLRQLSSLGNSGSADATHRESLILIDDVPEPADSATTARLSNALEVLCRHSLIPIVFCITTALTATDGSRAQLNHVFKSGDATRKLVNILVSLGPKLVTFPAATAIAISKVIDRIAQKERIFALLRNKQVVHELAEAACGDIRSAISNLQLYANGSIHCNRDPRLSIFHALGKILNNKRVCNEKELAEKSRGHPKENAEEVVAEARADPWFFLGCLNENLPEFVATDAIEDYALCTNAISEGVVLCEAYPSRRRRRQSDFSSTDDIHADGDDNLVSSLSNLAGLSVGVRGIMFFNEHPTPVSWRPLRAPPSLHSYTRSNGRNTTVPPMDVPSLLSEIACEDDLILDVEDWTWDVEDGTRTILVVGKDEDPIED